VADVDDNTEGWAVAGRRLGRVLGGLDGAFLASRRVSGRSDADREIDDKPYRADVLIFAHDRLMIRSQRP